MYACVGRIVAGAESAGGVGVGVGYVEVEAGEADLQGSFMAFRVTFSRSINTIVRGPTRIECNVKTITCG